MSQHHLGIPPRQALAPSKSVYSPEQVEGEAVGPDADVRRLGLPQHDKPRRIDLGRDGR